MKQLFVPPLTRHHQKTVYVRSYIRFRRGRWEHVRWHLRGLPAHRVVH